MPIHPSHFVLGHSDEQLKDESPEVRAAIRAAMEENVFGVGFKRDRHGKPIEQGIGSPGRETTQHREALARNAERKKLLQSLPG